MEKQYLILSGGFGLPTLENECILFSQVDLFSEELKLILKVENIDMVRNNPPSDSYRKADLLVDSVRTIPSCKDILGLHHVGSLNQDGLLDECVQLVESNKKLAFTQVILDEDLVGKDRWMEVLKYSGFVSTSDKQTSNTLLENGIDFELSPSWSFYFEPGDREIIKDGVLITFKIEDSSLLQEDQIAELKKSLRLIERCEIPIRFIAFSPKEFDYINANFQFPVVECFWDPQHAINVISESRILLNLGNKLAIIFGERAFNARININGLHGNARNEFFEFSNEYENEYYESIKDFNQWLIGHAMVDLESVVESSKSEHGLGLQIMKLKKYFLS